MDWAERARLGIRTLGEALITLGLLLFLFCVYQLFYTNVVADRAISSEISDLHHQWAVTAPAPRAKAAPPGSQPFIGNDSAGGVGDAFAIIHIPRLGPDFAAPILEGTSLDLLGKGVGHYQGTALPGQVGNFAVAGHRKTHGEPFRHLEEMRVGDYIVVETRDTWYTYREDRDPFIIDPTDLAIVDPVPDSPGKEPTQKLVTLTTCNPWWASYERMIVVGHLVAQQSRSTGQPAALNPPAPKFN